MLAAVSAPGNDFSHPEEDCGRQEDGRPRGAEAPAARDAREEGKRAGEIGASTGGSQQRTEARGTRSHQQRLDLKRQGTPDPLEQEQSQEARPGSRDADTLDKERFPRL